jgi:hypothetical protein
MMMTEETKSLALELLRGIRVSLTRMDLDLCDLKSRVSALEQMQGHVLFLLGAMSQRMDRFDERLCRIERRVVLVEMRSVALAESSQSPLIH